ncbi:MAG: PaaI family thioesterase [Streptosporangiales bacterium]|nr:PaaI family thioesterase [Streptosporangiales bacterium]
MRDSYTPPATAVVPERPAGAPAPGTVVATHAPDCFVCGTDGAALGLVKTIGDGVTVHAEFTVRPEHQGGPGVLHGGLLASAFDETLGALPNFVLGSIAVTGRLETEYVRPVPVGTTVHLRAVCDAVHGRKYYMSAEARLDSLDGPVAGRSRSLFIAVGVEHYAPYTERDDLGGAFRRARTAGDPA